MGEEFVCAECELEFNAEECRKYVCSECFNEYCSDCADENDNVCPTCGGIIAPAEDEE